jgi:hypothetical protein
VTENLQGNTESHLGYSKDVGLEVISGKQSLFLYHVTLSMGYNHNIYNKFLGNVWRFKICMDDKKSKKEISKIFRLDNSCYCLVQNLLSILCYLEVDVNLNCHSK